jgi:hypothetical protein
MLSVHTHMLPTSRAYHSTLRQMFEVFILLGQVLHLVCLVGGPLVLLSSLAWAMSQDEQTTSMLHALLTVHTPWQALRKLWVVYGALIWGVYLIPQGLKVTAYSPGKKAARKPAAHGRWQHAVLWGIIFGPLLYQYDKAAVLPPAFSVVVIAGLLVAFYEMVWRDA